MNIENYIPEDLKDPLHKAGDKVICCPDECIFRFIQGTVAEVIKLSEYEFEYTVICEDGKEFRTDNKYIIFKSAFDHLSDLMWKFLFHLDIKEWNRKNQYRSDAN